MASPGSLWCKGRVFTPDMQGKLTASQVKRLQARKLNLSDKTVDRLRQQPGKRPDGGRDLRRAIETVAGSKGGLGELRREELIALRQHINATLGDEDVREVGKTGVIVDAYGADPNKKYQVRYELREVDELVTSNTDSGAVNPAYPQELQPRDRTRMASRQQINEIAGKFQPDGFLVEFHSLDRGAPIIGEDNAVESGNGRTMAIRQLAHEDSEKYKEYKQRLREIARERGIDPREIDTMKAPVLVRVRQSDVDRVAFTEDANTRAGLDMSDTERSKSDARRISTGDLMNFTSTGSIDQDLKRTDNRTFVRAFVAELPANERAAVMDRTGDLTQTGVKRIKAAMFTRVYDDQQLADRIFESNDDDMKNISNGMMGSLGRVARAEELARSGQRNPDLTISHDVAVAVDTLGTVKAGGKMSVEEYLNQGNMFGAAITPTQRKILIALHERRRSGKHVEELLSNWASLVEQQPDPHQTGMFGNTSLTKDELVDRWLSTQGNAAQTSMF